MHQFDGTVYIVGCHQRMSTCLILQNATTVKLASKNK